MNEESIIKKHKKKHRQDKYLEERVIAIELVIFAFHDNQEARLILAECGYPDFEEGTGLKQAAQTAIYERDEAITAQRMATQQVRDVNKATRTTYGDFRKLAQVVYKTDAARAALGLKGRVPADRARFLRHARAGYEAALTPEFAPALERRGLHRADIEAGLALLDALVTADAAQIAAKAAAQQATANRKAAMRRLDDWFIEFRDTAKLAFRDHMEWLPLLKIR